MKYYISRKLRLDRNAIEINKDQYDLMVIAYNNLSQSIFLEEKFDILLENYSEYEIDLLTIAWDSILYIDYKLIDSANVRDLITRKIINLLGTGYIFHNQWKKHLRAMSWTTPIIIRKIKDFETEQKKQLLGFRFSCELRNYSTHNDLPMSIYRTSFNVDETLNGRPYFRSAVIPGIELTTLTKDEKMRGFENDLKIRFEDEIDLRPLIREYILGLYNINNFIREITEVQLTQSEGLLVDAGKKLHLDTPNEMNSIYLIQQAEGTERFNYQAINFGFIARRKMYAKKNSLSDSFLNFYATNKI